METGNENLGMRLQDTYVKFHAIHNVDTHVQKSRDETFMVEFKIHVDWGSLSTNHKLASQNISSMALMMCFVSQFVVGRKRTPININTENQARSSLKCYMHAMATPPVAVAHCLALAAALKLLALRCLATTGGALGGKDWQLHPLDHVHLDDITSGFLL